MNVLSWNCRGLNDPTSPTIPYLRWLLASYHPSFLFLQETKTSVNNVASMLRSTCPTSFSGFDAVDTRGGIAVFCWGPYNMDVVDLSRNFVLCKITSINGKVWHCLFLYGEPQIEHRATLWNELKHRLHPYKNYLIIGDINQVEYYSDKIGGATLIRGWEDFVTWKHELHLRDVPFYGPRFTWTNNRTDSDLIMERLDRAYASPDWFENFPNTRIQNFPIIQSDHAPIWLQTLPSTSAPLRPYQLENWCLRIPEVINITLEVWQIYIAGSAMYRLSKKLSLLRSRLKSWCLDKRMFWGVNWKNVFSTLQFQGNQIQTLDQGVSLIQRHRSLMNEASLALTYWQQRSKDRHLQLGDIPSKYLFNRLRQHKERNFVYMLRKENGEWTEDFEDITQRIQYYFKDIYHALPNHNLDNSHQGGEIDCVLRELNLPCISERDAQLLTSPITDQEIRNAIFDIANDKSPGLDGIPAEFFKFHWDITGTLVIEAIKRFFSTGHLLREWNNTLLVLIPKVNPPEEVSQFRPISLCNVIYKGIAKCMVNRMKPMLPSLIDEFQNAFVPGRHMDDNILISHEITHIINKQRSGNQHLAALKLDMNKAYDRVNWLFILKILQAYGFPNTWVQLIQQCITTVSYRLLINGTVTPTFYPKCGLRQGDPLSPYLFLFCMDILSRMTSLRTDMRYFQGIKIGKQGPTISHLFFADDALFFFKASEKACHAVNSVVSRFCLISGQMINRQKSFVKFSPNIPIEHRQKYKELLQMEDKPTLGSYLGTPIDIQGSKIQHFTPLLDTVSEKIAKWNYKQLSQPSKLIIINSILVATIMHQLAVLPIPTTIANKLDAMLARFFWKNNQQIGIHWKSKAILHQPRGQGGLGIRNVGCFNTALLMKKVWRIIQHPQILLSRVFRSSNHQEPWIRNTKHKMSLGRRGMLKASQTMKQLCVWKVGNGRSIHAASQPWASGKIPLFRDQVNIRTAANLSVADLILPDHQGWNSMAINRLFLPLDARLIQSMELPYRSDVEDRYFWPFTRSGNYSTKSGYGIILQHQQNENYSMTSPVGLPFFRHLWGMNIMPKWKLFVWKLWHNSLATSSNLHHRGITPQSQCATCLHDIEDVQHIFRFCPLAIEAWDGSDLGVQPVTPIEISLGNWLEYWMAKFIQEDGMRSPRIPKFIGTLWAIWKTRNGQVFRNIRATEEVFNNNIRASHIQHSKFIAEDRPPLLPPLPPTTDLLRASSILILAPYRATTRR